MARQSRALLEEAEDYVSERRRTVVLAVRERVSNERLRLDHARANLGRHAETMLTRERERMSSRRSLLSAYDPLQRLHQGWSLVRDSRGLISSVETVRVGQTLTVTVADGEIDVTVTEKRGH